MTRLIVGMSGASGAIYGVRMLQVLHEYGQVETHLVMSPAARQTIALETDWKPRDVEAMADVVHRYTDIAASISSGSFKVQGMIILPCSVRTLASIATSMADNLLTRAADVTLKERRPLLLALRETPLHLGHIRAMEQAASIGAHLVPLMPAFYSRPKTIEDLVDQTVGRLLDQLDIELPVDMVDRWQGPAKGQS
jgi:4-hydroxy-3-polyprenylbenzoate decarboxylase